jgi:hypothetical protein
VSWHRVDAYFEELLLTATAIQTVGREGHDGFAIAIVDRVCT